MKKCSLCKKAKPYCEFYQDKTKKHNLSSRCKECVRQQAKDWAVRHPEERQRIMRDWQARTDLQAHNRKIWIKRGYGKTLEDIEQLFLAQDGLCAICEHPLTRYHIDHNHKSGEIRGLLCRHCNVGLGFFQDSSKRLMAAVRYLRAAL